MLAALIDNVNQLLQRQSNQPVFIIIDGFAGAGKTTLADSIISELGAGDIIHCDDLYNGWEDALTPTFEKHLQEWVITPLRQGNWPCYQKYNWANARYEEVVLLKKTPLIILEGVGSAIKNVSKFADISIWIEIDPELGLARVIERDGEEIREKMLDWLALQDKFFHRHGNRLNANLHLPYGAPKE